MLKMKVISTQKCEIESAVIELTHAELAYITFLVGNTCCSTTVANARSCGVPAEKLQFVRDYLFSSKDLFHGLKNALGYSPKHRN